MQVPDRDSLATLLGRLGAAPADVQEVLRTIPSAEHDPDLWALLERSHRELAGILSREDSGVRGVQGPMPSRGPALPLFDVHLILLAFEDIRRCHRRFGIPDDISWETLSFLGRALTAYRASHGEAGIQITRWDWLRFLGYLYEVGRLEVTPYRLSAHPEAGPLFWYDEEAAARLGPGFQRGNPALGIHVPASAPLTPQACEESLERMRNAFTGMYPGEPLRAGTCTSWLLDEQLAEYLPSDSNIVTFQRNFQLVPGAREDDEPILRFVFGPEHPKEIDALPQRTALERAVVNHLRAGRHWRIRTGWVEISASSNRPDS